MTEQETFWDRVARIERDHNISPAEAIRVARAEEHIEAAKTERRAAAPITTTKEA